MCFVILQCTTVNTKVAFHRVGMYSGNVFVCHTYPVISNYMYLLMYYLQVMCII